MTVVTAKSDSIIGSFSISLSLSLLLYRSRCVSLSLFLYLYLSLLISISFSMRNNCLKLIKLPISHYTCEFSSELPSKFFLNCFLLYIWVCFTIDIRSSGIVGFLIFFFTREAPL